MVFAPHWLAYFLPSEVLSSLRVLIRYDLRVLFEKAHGEFSVNVQALSRVCHIALHFATLI